MGVSKNKKGLFIKNFKECLLVVLPIFCIILFIGIVLASTITTNIETATSNTSDSTPAVVFNYTCSDLANTNCSLRVNGVTVATNTNVTNATQTTLNSTALTDGSHTVDIFCWNGSDTDASSEITLTVDTVGPASTITAPASNYENDDGGIDNLTGTSTDATLEVDTVKIYIKNGTHYFSSATTGFNTTSLTWLTATYNSTTDIWNYTNPIDNLTENMNYTVLVWANDTVSNEANTSTWYLYDNTTPTYSWSVVDTDGATSSTVDVNVTVTDSYSNMDTCSFNVYSPAGTSTAGTATTSGTGATQYCYLSINNDYTSGVGGIFETEITATDRAGNSAVENASQNVTVNYLKAGWNLLQADRNATLGTYNMTGTVTKIAWYNNSAGSFTTWTRGTATNENTTITDGDAVYIYVSANSYYFRKWEENMTSRNLTYGSGWNLASHYNTSSITLENLCDESIDNASVAIKYTTYVDTDGIYTSHRCGFTYNADTTIPRGFGYWLNVNATVTQGRSRE